MKHGVIIIVAKIYACGIVFELSNQAVFVFTVGKLVIVVDTFLAVGHRSQLLLNYVN